MPHYYSYIAQVAEHLHRGRKGHGFKSHCNLNFSVLFATSEEDYVMWMLLFLDNSVLKSLLIVSCYSRKMSEYRLWNKAFCLHFRQFQLVLVRVLIPSTLSLDPSLESTSPGESYPPQILLVPSHHGSCDLSCDSLFPIHSFSRSSWFISNT